MQGVTYFVLDIILGPTVLAKLKESLETAIRCRRASHGSVSRVNFFINRNAYGSNSFICEKKN